MVSAPSLVARGLTQLRNIESQFSTLLTTTMILSLLQYLCLFPAAIVAVRFPFVLQDYGQNRQSATHHNVKVSVQLGVMSRCPDALLCESVFNGVMERVAEKMELSLTYVAKYGHSTIVSPSYVSSRIDASEPDFGVRCKHGPDECAGNVQQLCVAKHEPLSSWWEFVQCQNYEGIEKIGNAEVTLKCARIAGIDWNSSQAGECAGLDGNGKGTEGVKLLQKSVVLSHQLGIE